MSEERTITQPETRKKGRLVVIVAVLLGTVAAAGVGGAILGTQVLSSASPGPAAHGTKGEKGAHGAGSAEAEAEDTPVAATLDFSPIVVDFKSEEGETHHLKIGMTAELGDAKHGAKEVEMYVPRGREAAIVYIRTLSFEEATSPKEFERVRRELSERVVEAMGEGRVSRIVITDFVAQ